MMRSMPWKQSRAARQAAAPSAAAVGHSVRDRTDDWLIIWEREPTSDDLIIIRYLGTDPFA